MYYPLQEKVYIQSSLKENFSNSLHGDWQDYLFVFIVTLPIYNKSLTCFDNIHK